MWRSHAPDRPCLSPNRSAAGNGNGLTLNRMHRAAVQLCRSLAMTGWDFFAALLGCAALIPAASARNLRLHADTLPSSVLPAFALHPAGAGRARARAPHHRGAGVGAPGGVPDAQPGRHHAGAGAEGYPPVPGAATIAEFLDETQRRRAAGAPAAAGRHRPAGRGAPARRLVQREILRRGQRPAGAGALLQAAHAHRAGRRPARHRRDPCGADQCPLSYRLYRMAGAHPRLAGRRPA